MKTYTKLIFVFAALSLFFYTNKTNAQCVAIINNPATCPSYGQVFATHPILGDANPAPYWGYGYSNAHISWDLPLPGIYETHFYCQSPTVPGGENTSWDAMYCYDSDDVYIGFGYNLSVYLSPHPVLIFDEEDPE